MNKTVEVFRAPWLPVFHPTGGYGGEPCQGDLAEGHYLGSITYNDCGMWDAELNYHMSVAGEGPSVYHLFEIQDSCHGFSHLGYMEGDAPDLATAGLALLEALLMRRDPRFLDPRSFIPAPLFTPEQAQGMLERVELAHQRAFHPEQFPDLRAQMLTSAQALLAKAEALAMDRLPGESASGSAPQGLQRVGLLWEEPLLKVRYFVRREPARVVLVQDRSRMERLGGNVSFYRPVSHEVRDVAACDSGPDDTAEALGILLLLRFRPDHRLQSLEGINGLTEKGLRLLLAIPETARPDL